MSERKLKTTHATNEEQIKKTREYMKRMNTTGKEYNPAPKESKDGKVQK
tara:strand:- start:307 stop:453 length:147 start_codon:yes stop_codon:yes gene_type:complete